MKKVRSAENQYKKRILVIDDDPLIGDVLKEFLLYMGFFPLVARKSSEALELFHSWKGEFDLILMDLILQEKYYLETFSAIKKLRNDVKIVVMSGYIDHEKLRKIPEMNLKGYIQKPFDVERLFHLIQEALL